MAVPYRARTFNYADLIGTSQTALTNQAWLKANGCECNFVIQMGPTGGLPCDLQTPASITYMYNMLHGFESVGIPFWMEIELPFENTWHNLSSSTITPTAAVGQKDITMYSIAGFSHGNVVTIWGINGWEQNTVDSVGATTLTMVNNLTHDYPTGSSVTVGGNPMTPETLPFDDSITTVATESVGGEHIYWEIGMYLPSFETMFGAAVTQYNTLGPMFQGYSIEGGFENGLIWLSTRAHADGKKVSSYLRGMSAWNQRPNSLPPDFGDVNPFPPTPPYYFYTTGDLGAWLSYVDEVVWECYCTNEAAWLILAIAWVKENMPTLRQGINTIFTASLVEQTSGVTFWGPWEDVASVSLPELSKDEMHKVASYYFWQFKQALGPGNAFYVAETDMHNDSTQPIIEQAQEMIMFNLTVEAKEYYFVNIAELQV